MRLASIAALAIVGAVAFAAACSDEPVVLATIPGDPNDGGARSGDTRCVANSDCSEGSFCEKYDCDDTAGTCTPYPALCGDEEHTVCGCDGVTYFNDCLRRAAGISHGRLDECSAEAVTCGGPSNTPCPGAAVCAKLLGFGGTCSGNEKGTCWVLPVTCPAPSHADRFDDCDPNGAQCVDACTAIKSGKTYLRATRCG